MQQLEIREYSRSEIAKITGYDPRGSHFARDVKATLSKWGYEYHYTRSGIQIIKQPETAEEKLAEILIRKLNIDVQINPESFATFLYALQWCEQFDSMPWHERAEMLCYEYNMSVDERTLRNWCSKLIAKGIISKTRHQSFWKTSLFNGRKCREMIDPYEEEVSQYYQRRDELRAMYERQFIESGDTKKEASKKAWTSAFYDMWQEYHCCYYYCNGLNLNALSLDEDDYLSEIYELVDEIISRDNPLPHKTEPTGKEEFDAQWFYS